MQRFQEWKAHLGSNLGYTGIKVAIGCGAVIAVSLITTQYYMKWNKKRKIIRIIDTFEEFQNGCVHIKYPDEVEDKVLQLIKGGSAKIRILADFDQTLLLPEVYAELVNIANADSSKRASNGFGIDKFQLPEEKCLLHKSEFIEDFIQSIHHSNGYRLNGKVEQYDSEICKPVESLLRKECTTFFDTVYKHKFPLSLFTGHEEFVKKLISYTSITPDIYLTTSKEKKDDSANKDLHQRPNTIILGDIPETYYESDDSNTVLHIGFLEDEVNDRLPEYIAKYDIVVTSEPCIKVINAFLQHIV